MDRKTLLTLVISDYKEEVEDLQEDLQHVITVVGNQLITNRIAQLELAIKTSEDMLKRL